MKNILVCFIHDWLVGNRSILFVLLIRVNTMIPFPFLRRNNRRKHKFFCVYIKQVGTSAKHRNGCGYYRIENNMLIGKNGQISIEEFMKEAINIYKKRERSRDGYIVKTLSYLRFVSCDTSFIKVYPNKVCLFDFMKNLEKSLRNFLSQEDFLCSMPRLLFDNEQYVGIGCL